jgi:hypothetical protein
MVQAGLLHSVYALGDFGDGRSGVTRRRRRQLGAAVGETVEALIEGFARFPWDPESLSTLADRLPSFSEGQCDVALLRLVNELEVFLDGGIIYHADPKRRSDTLRTSAPYMIALANHLRPELADPLRSAIDEALAYDAADWRPYPGSLIYATSPRSYRRRMRVLFTKGLSRLRRTLAR